MNAPAKKHAPPDVFVELAVELLDDSPTNPRSTYHGIEELGASMREQGVIQPLVVRPRPKGRYEIAAGHRRKRGAQAAGLHAVPCIVRVLSDEQMLELQLVENLQREDLDPIEEGKAYQRLQKEAGLSVDQICDRVGKSRSWVYGRIKLCELVPDAQRALADGKILASTALAIARLDATQQPKALKAAQSWDGEGLTYREAVRRIERELHLPLLNEAPFDLARADLPGGACTACPKSIAHADEGAICTDTSCWSTKVEQNLDEQRTAATAKGVRVLSSAESARAFDAYGNTTAEWFRLDRPCYQVDRGKKLGTVLGKAARKRTVLAEGKKGDAGRLLKLISAADLEAALIEVGLKKEAVAVQLRTKATKPTKPTKKEIEAGKRRKEELERKRETHKAKVLELLAQVEQGNVPPWIYLALAEYMAAGEGGPEACERRGLPWHSEKLRPELRKLKPIEVLSLIVESLVGDEYEGMDLMAYWSTPPAKKAPAKKAPAKKAPAKKAPAKKAPAKKGGAA